jgi:Rps23 Pro-64 3,4-dihydroxylase Tpa1-like proline 4-hydroxylase
MKLIYNLEDKLFWIHNFLPNHEYKRIHNEIFKERKKLKYQNVSKTWQKTLTNNLTPPNRLDINPNYFNFYKTLLLHQPFIKINSKDVSFIIHNMGKNSGINWHRDSLKSYGITYYINKRWNPDWGGEFMFKHNGNHGYLPVVGNSLVIIKTPMFHKVNPVLSPIIPRLSVQSFIK